MGAGIPNTFLALLFCFLLQRSWAQQTDSPWSWIMADSINSSLVCPGRCLAVNDSSYPGDYENKPVGFVACKSGSGSSSSSNNNQQWIIDGQRDVTIKINASDAFPPDLLCLQPSTTNKNQPNIGLTVTKCTAKPDQKWVVANNSIASRAFGSELRYLVMGKKLLGFLSNDGTDDGTSPWRQASLLAKNDSRLKNKSLMTKVFSVVDSNVDFASLAPPPLGNVITDSHNFIQNGGFESSSFDFPSNVTRLEIAQDEIFGLCNWQVMNPTVTVLDSTVPSPVGNRSLLLNGGILKQRAATVAGATYSLVFNMAVANPNDTATEESSSSEDSCKGTTTLYVNPFPSTNVHVTVTSNSTIWETRHVSFQALSNELLLTFTGCESCGCHLDEANLMQVVNSAPFPPPPFYPSPPANSSGSNHTHPRLPSMPRAGIFGPGGLGGNSNRLSDGAVAGLVVGASVLFALIGFVCSDLVHAEKKEAKPQVEMVRPHEWSIETTTPARSEDSGQFSSKL
eukprot:Gb_03242 [translate_table: standard]